MGHSPGTEKTEVPEGARGYEGFGGRIARTMSESSPWWPPVQRPSDGAPNIIVMLVDDMGFSDIGPFGSEIDTPNLDRLAGHGVNLTNYHTAPVCSPARASLMTGLNPHRAGFSTVAAFDPGFPNTVLELADDVSTLPEALRESGYATYMVGKWHLTREGLTGEGSSRSSWPTQRGFDRYYGCLEGFTPFMAPNRLIRDQSPIEVDRYPEDYYLTDDLTDEAIKMVRGLRAHAAEQPFFLYFAHHAMHAPFAAKPVDLAKYRGRYDEGWDVLRERRFAKQKELGLFPEDTVLPPPNDDGPAHFVPPWDSRSPEQQDTCARLMEVYAAMVDNLDQNLGRLLDVLEENDELDNTIIVFTSDNGGANDGGATGTRNYLANFLAWLEVGEDWCRDTEVDPALIGGPRTMPQYPRGWAMVSNTPFRLYKGTTFAGGVRTPMIVHWPAGLGDEARGSGFRRQYVHVADVAPTLLEAAGVKAPSARNGLPVKDIDGTSFLGALRDEQAQAFRTTQYSEFNGHRGLYSDGWNMLTLHRPDAEFSDGEWQLFDLASDPTETTDIAAEHPDLVTELSATWEKEAWANTVFPLNDNLGHLAWVERPSADTWEEPLTITQGTPQLERGRSARLVHRRSFNVVIDLEPTPEAQGVLVAHGDQSGGYVVYVEDGEVVFEYNEYGLMHRASVPMSATGTSRVILAARWLQSFRWEFTLTVDGTDPVVLGPVQMLLQLAPFTGIDVGVDRGGPVSWAMHERHGSFRYDGRIGGVRYEPGEMCGDDPSVLFKAYRDAAPGYD